MASSAWRGARAIAGGRRRRRDSAARAGAATLPLRRASALGLQVQGLDDRVRRRARRRRRSRFEARAGAVHHSLIGPNGAGKTTVLNMLSGFYRRERGIDRASATSRSSGLRAWRIARAGVARTYQTSQLFGTPERRRQPRAGGAARPARPPARRARLRAPQAGSAPRRCSRSAAIAGDTTRAPPICRTSTGAWWRSRARWRPIPTCCCSTSPRPACRARTRSGWRRCCGASPTPASRVLVEHDMALVMGISDQVVVLDAGPAPSPPARPPRCRPTTTCAGPISARRSPPTLPPRATGAQRRRADARGRQARRRLRRRAGAEGHRPAACAQGEMVAVLGANGAGKSTLMRALAGLHRPVRGGIALRRRRASRLLGAHRSWRAAWCWCPKAARCFPS